MEPKKSFLGWLTREGRIKNRWASALAESDASRAVERLRQVQQSIRQKPAAYAHLWLPFVNSLLDAARARALTDGDLKAAEEMGDALVKAPTEGVRPEQIWLRVVEARDARKEDRQAKELLTRIYNAPGMTAETKASCARDLARRGSKGDKQIDIYLDHLTRAPELGKETVILELLASICAVDFDSGKANLNRAGEVAARLVKSKIKVSGSRAIEVAGMHTALGLHCLLIKERADEAVKHFEAAYKADRESSLAITGLLASLVQRGNYAQVAKVAKEVGRTKEAVINGLVRLSATLAWLESGEEAGPPPATAREIEDLKLNKYAGHKVDLAVGKLHLLEGDAKRAAEILMPLADLQQTNLDWGYHAAWAALLKGDTEAIERIYRSLGESSDKWVVACLLIEAEPEIAQRFSRPYQMPTKESALFNVRLAMAQSKEFKLPHWVRDKVMALDLESLRTVLAGAIFNRSRSALEQKMALPLFERLPLPDQITWRGLKELRFGNPMQGRALLEEAALKFGYRRAAMILAVHLLNEGNVSEAKSLLSRITSAGKNARMNLLLAYTSACEGRTEAAVERLEALAVEGEPRASYALGNLYLHRAEQARTTGQPELARLYREQAAGALGAALKSAARHLPADSTVRAACAEFIADPRKEAARLAALKDDAEQLGPSRRQPWVMWNLILARVWSGASSDVCEAGERLLDLLEQAEEPGPEAAGAIAQMIARACLNASNAAEAEKLLKVLERLSVASPATVRRFYRLGVTAGARLRSQDEGTREQARQQAARLAKSDPGNGAIALLLSQMHLEEGDLESAIAALQQASPEDELERELCSHLSDLLGGNSPTVDKLPRAFQDDSRGAAPSVALLKAAVAFASQASEQGYEALLASLGGRAEEAASVINVARLAPTLCAQSSRSAVPPALVEIIKRMVDRPGDEEEMLRLARCAAAIGEPAAACRLWERALAAYRQPEAALRQEYAAYLCHLAVAAKNSGKPSDAARSLRGAASIAAGGSKGA